MLRSAIRASVVAASLLVAPLALTASQALAETSRLALVIGQSAYRAVAPLPNPANDAGAMAKMLEEAGFEVSTAADLSQTELRASVSDFAAKLADRGPDAVALVFYAGHGIQVDGENYLIPIDVDPRREADVPLQAVRLDDVLNTLAAVPSRMRIVLLDACRNNPFPGINRTTGSGLAMVDAKTGAAGTFISYSTSPGAEAEDGSGANSPYTAALLKVAREPGLSIEEAFKRVRVAVAQETDGRQVPWDSSSLTDSFNFFGGDATAPKPKTDEPRRSAGDWRKTLTGKAPEAAYELVLADDSVTAYEVFVTLFAKAPQAPRVRSLLERRQEMETWRLAVLNNTATAYETFLAGYGGSDLAATARRLQQRARARSLDADKAAQAAAIAPACQCSVPTPPEKTRTAPRSRRAATPPPAHEAGRRLPPRRPPILAGDGVMIYDPPPRRPPPVYVPPIVLGPGGRPPIYNPPTRPPPVYQPPTRLPPGSGRGPILRDTPIVRGSRTGGNTGGGPSSPR